MSDDSTTPISAADYDEFGLFHENAEEAGLDWSGPPTVARVTTTLPDGRVMTALRWGTEPPEIVFLHGGGQNAHTWDTVALALDRPLLAVDLPGHGHSDEPDLDQVMGPRTLAADVAPVIAEHAPDAAAVVGMSLGGLTAVEVATIAPELVRSLLLVDVTPGTNREKASDIVTFLAGPESFESFEEILERTMAFNPTRSESSLRRGILHNATQRDDGRWVWRHQRGDRSGLRIEGDGTIDFESLWADVAAIDVPVTLVCGELSPVVDDADRERFAREQPDASIVMVADAGHSIQGDQPIELARLIAEFVDGANSP